MTHTTDLFAEFKDEMESLTKRMTERGKEIFKAQSHRIFDENLELEYFSWTQYTPYWCDGDVCEFSVNSWDISGKWNGEMYEGSYNCPREFAKVQKEIKTLLDTLPEETMKAVFGDHVKVTAYPDRVEVEEYDHE